MSTEMPECLIAPEKLKEMHKSLNELRLQNKFCDVTIMVKGTPLRAHAGILCAHSEYLRNRIKKVEGDGEKVIELVEAGLDVDIVNQCIEYIYTGHIELDIRNLDWTIIISTLFEVPGLHECLQKQLMDTMDVYIAMVIRRLVGRFRWNNVCTYAEKLLVDNTWTVFKSDIYLIYDSFEISWMMNHRKPSENQKEEAIIWESVIKWVEHDKPNRESDIFCLIRKVDLSKLSISFLNDKIRTEKTVMESQQCMKYLLQHLFSRLTANGGAKEIENSEEG